VGRNGSGGVSIMSVPSIVLEKSCGNKKCDEEKINKAYNVLGIIKRNFI